MKKLILIGLCTGALCLTACAPEKEVETQATTVAEAETTTVEVTTTAEETEPETTASKAQPIASDLVLSDDIYSFQISIDGVVYQFPMKFSDFIATGWLYVGDEKSGIPSDARGFSDYFKKGGMSYTAPIVNFGQNEAQVSDCYLGGINVDNSYSKATEKVLLPKGIELGVSTVEDVKAAYGEPTRFYEGTYDTTLTYEESSYNEVEIRVSKETGTVKVIEISNLTKPENFTEKEVDTTIVPPIVEAYQAPAALGEDIYGYTVEFDGSLYQLPAPVSEFIKNGWSIVENASESTINGDGYGKVTLMKNNQRFHTFVTNYFKNSTSIENCFVTNLSAGDIECKVAMNLPGGINMDLTQQELEAAIAGMDYKTDGDKMIYYEISDPASLTYGYEIIVQDGKVYKITMKYNPSYKEYNKRMGVE